MMTILGSTINNRLANKQLINKRLVYQQLANATYALRRSITVCASTVTLLMFGLSLGFSAAANAAPTVSLNAPANNATFITGTDVVVSANAASTGQTITQVEFFANTIPATTPILIGAITTAPYSVTWLAAPAGSYTLTAKATDSVGATKTSTARTINIATPPTVTLTAPAAASQFGAPASITLTADVNQTAPQTISNVKFYRGTTLIGTATTAPYTATWNNAAAGTYTLSAKATNNLNQATTSATVNIAITASPTVALSAPANNAGFSVGNNITISANATPSSGQTIAQVEFFANTIPASTPILIGTVTTAPYSVTWATAPAGSYTLTAKASDNLGATKTSAARTINIASPPTVNLTAPIANAQFGAPATIILSADAIADAGQTISNVKFYRGTTLIGTATTAPYTVTWNNAAAGTYSLTAKATTNLNLVNTSTASNITVTTSPTVALTAPANNASFTANPTITINANATPSSGQSITQVQFIANTVPATTPILIGTDTTAPYSVSWANVAGGSYTLTAKATDNLNGTKTSAARAITIAAAANVAPTVSIIAPTSGATYTASANVTLTANATDTDGTISQIQFYNGTNLLGTATPQGNSSYTFSWNNVATGTYTITAIATDNSNATTTSSPVNISVGGGAAQIYYIHTDQLDTPRVITNQSNTVVWRWDSDDPFGNNPPNDDPNSTGNHFEFNHRHAGQYYDVETFNFYNYNRDYDPQTGRYIESDPIGLEGGINTYAYVGGNPMSKIDPRGLEIQSPNTGGAPNSRGPLPCSGNDCVNPPVEPKSDGSGAGNGPQPDKPIEPITKKYGKCNPIIEYCFGGCTCADTSVSMYSCVACCTTVMGYIRSGGGACQVGCMQKYQPSTFGE